jgi:hypothetical protein
VKENHLCSTMAAINKAVFRGLPDDRAHRKAWSSRKYVMARPSGLMVMSSFGTLVLDEEDKAGREDREGTPEVELWRSLCLVAT